MSAQDNAPDNKSQIAGTVIRVSGTVIDAEFPRDHVPGIFHALRIEIPTSDMALLVEQVIGRK